MPKIADMRQKTHSQPDMQRIGFESETPKQPRAISFQSRLKQLQKFHHEQQYNSQDRADMAQPLQVDYNPENTPEYPGRQPGAYVLPSLLHRPPIGDIFYHKQNPWEQQDATMSDGENFASPKSLSRSSISDYRMTAIPTHVPHHQESSGSFHTDHWTISSIEDPALRDEFPNVNGYLFEVRFNKSKNGLLGLRITANTTNQSLPGIVVMGIQKGGAAEENGKIKLGDMILKVNDTCVIGMSQTHVQELLATASPNVRFVLLRQYGNSATGGGGGGGGGAKQKVDDLFLTPTLV